MTCRISPWPFAMAAALLLSSPAQAQLFRAYLSPDGHDDNACTRPAPCRLLPKALMAVADGGEVWMLGSANYNTAPVAITKSVTILAVPGAVGSVVATAGNAINIATGGVKVVLRNLTIVPSPGTGGQNGIVMTAGAALTVERCHISGLPQSGLVVNAAASLRLTDTTLRDNGLYGLWIQNGARATVTRATVSGQTLDGIVVQGTVAGTTTVADIADSVIDGNAFGVFALSENASAAVRVSVHRSRSAQNFGGAGLIARSDFGAPVVLSVTDSIVSNNGAGIGALSAGAVVWASGNTVAGNGGAGFYNSGAVFESAGNNAVRHSAFADTAGAITPIATK